MEKKRKEDQVHTCNSKAIVRGRRDGLCGSGRDRGRVDGMSGYTCGGGRGDGGRDRGRTGGVVCGSMIDGIVDSTGSRDWRRDGGEK